MEYWQWIVLGVLVLLPMGLMVDFWGDERVNFRGRPIDRDWVRQPPRIPAGQEQHPDEPVH